jgi:ATP-dependent helicase HrpB
METVDLAGFVLELAVWGVEPSALAFLQPPPQSALDDGRALLWALGALDQSDGRPTLVGRRMAELPLHPRLARLVIGAIPLGHGRLACALAASLEDRDVIRGRPDVVEADVAMRARLITDPSFLHPHADGAAVSTTRRRANELARRAGVVAGGAVDLQACGLVLALAYPDRIAQARGGGRFRLRNGAGAWLAESDPLSSAPFLVVAALDADQRDSRIRLATALDSADLETAAGAAIRTTEALAWDPGRNDVRATVTRTLDGLVLGTTERKAQPGPQARAALLGQVRATDLGALSWTDAARRVQQRVAFLRRTFGADWPDLSDRALVTALDQWLAPLLTDALERRDLERIDLARELRMLLPHARRAELDRLAPTSMALGRRSVRIDYGADSPRLSVRLSDLFGIDSHPNVAGGRVPIVLELLSPAGRPVQVTSDLPGFWAGSYAAVRKDLAGRYPKHRWPVDPLASGPSEAPGRKR